MTYMLVNIIKLQKAIISLKYKVQNVQENGLLFCIFKKLGVTSIEQAYSGYDSHTNHNLTHCSLVMPYGVDELGYLFW